MVKSRKIVIATHYLMYGAAHALRDYLNEGKIEDLLCIGLPFHTQRSVIVEKYKFSKLISSSKNTRSTRSEIIGYFFDFFTVLSTVLRKPVKYDLFIGVNNLNCLSGIVLRKLGKVKKVVYYSIDFVPIRFENAIINYIYHKIEKYAVIHADQVWNVSPRIAEGRQSFLKIKNSKKQIVVPIGFWDKDVKLSKYKHKNKNKVVFIGHVLEKQGLSEVIKAIPDISNEIKNFKLIIIGNGDYLKTLKSLVEKLKISKYIIFTGQIDDKNKISKILSTSSLAVATYKPEKEKLRNFTYYADPTKIKDYLSFGLPVITTNVPFNALELSKKRCAIVVEYNSKEIAKAIKSMLINVQKLSVYQKNALQLSKKFTWDKIFSSLTI